MDVSRLSFMSPLGYQSNSCGYCHSSRETSLSFYAHSPRKVHPRHYQGLVDRGWRRSGTTYYKPDVRHACCPHYTIRLNAADFKPAGEQRSAVNKFNNYVLGVEYKRKAARLCPKTRQEKRFRREHFELSTVVHEAEYRNVKRPADPDSPDKLPLEPAHRLEISLESDSYTSEKFALFENYQRLVHKESAERITRSSFKSFLCSGLGRDTFAGEDGKSRKIGSHHMCYRLDGKLVAIGVLDLLPSGVSSVYLMYHDDVSEWEFGKLSAMHEIALAREEGYGYYYMGYYIHSCPKMRYKQKFRPTYALDPESYEWHPLDKDMLQLLDKRSYVSISRNRIMGTSSSQDSIVEEQEQEQSFSSSNRPQCVFDAEMPGVMSRDEVAKIDLSTILIGIGNELMTLGHLDGWHLDEEEQSPLMHIAEFVACIGPELAKSIVIVFR